MVKKGDRASMHLTDNIGYGAFREPHSNELMYNGIGSRRNGVYGGNLNGEQTYAIYDVVL